ncbi:Oxygen-independent coproporphyrinogen-III oxidase 1 (coproporphyrinogenase) [Desulfonema limicola]|uniref:Heme chaperone HemW n=1 Tax=Desulfonema limicola TaxID=45656 RepID=A0A975B492_9BACT|nr:radical SAM family heme chaperone HemW [Desulfonema limicola]QTA78527.1 Oxygen-independent coproporphyrinogen-III oxidase 1 (coproporphyrinogenase) [Desulfonema limicola]
MKTIKEPGGIYIHIPFCIKKCDYCNFYSVPDLSLEQDFVNALVKEITMAAAQVCFPCNTIYMGGGTPSTLKTKHIQKIIKSIFKNLNILPDPEITIEVNPGTVNTDTLKAYFDAGINRINIGVQSFNNENLKFMGRIHSVQDAENALKWAEDAGFVNTGIDLIYGLPAQNQDLWIYDLQKAVNHKPAHISCYMLTFEHGTPLDKRRLKGEFSLLDDEISGNLFETTINFLKDKTYEQYEISNFAKTKAQRSKHNLKYWSFAPYLGLGPSAHSFLFPKRQWNYNSLKKYITSIKKGNLPVKGSEILNREQQIMEFIYLGLRTNQGIDTDMFNRYFNINFYQVFGNLVKELKKQGIITGDTAFCALSKKGMRFQDSITRMFMCQDF